MGNLGWYQKITTWSKKVGGPQNLLLLVAAGGYGLGKGIEVVGKKLIKRNKEKKLSKNTAIYRVCKSCIDNNGVEFCVGDAFKVLETDGTAILIEKIGDDNNPYFVDKNLLSEISDYK